MDYKDTLLLPSTTFPMRGNLPQNEPQTYQTWNANQYAYNTMCANRQNSKDSFTLHDGPPYANGHLHIGHALNKILKDIIIKLHYFKGQSVRYTPGWDCHGLPIEQQVEKEQSKSSLSTSAFRALCRKHAQKFLSIQMQEFKDLGVLGDFANPYKTMDFGFEASIYQVLAQVAQKGLLAERSKPIFWSWAARSALAEAEVEYKDKEDHSIFVGFPLTKESLQALKLDTLATHKPIQAVIWTTTPWTLPANQAICLHPNESYIITQEGYIIAKALLESIVQEGISKGKILAELQGSSFENYRAINPLNGRESLLIVGEHVLMSGGSGLVHSAPGHGEEDYFACLKYELEVLMPVDDRGCYDESLREKGLFRAEDVGQFIGMRVFDANEKILPLLGEHLLKSAKFIHSYPHCWRTHEPVIYRATKQWFILMDKPYHNGKTLRQVALEAIEKTKFYPESGRNRIRTMIENRPDWCISRQRAWGVPIAFFVEKSSGKAILDSSVLAHIGEIFSKKGCDVWWELDNAKLLPESHKHRASELEKCQHILDVWFDSGSTWFGVLKSGFYDAGNFPADMYLEGSDQHRGWFQSSLLLSCALQGIAPYKSVLTHGFTMDERGEKMSKSKGNVILPQEVLKSSGSEILRLWVALSDYQNDQKISKNILQQVGEQYKKLRNTLRFLLANCNDLQTLSDPKDLSQIDRFIIKLARIHFLRVQEEFANYNFASGLQTLMHFITNDLSGIYLDLCKDSLYCDSADDKGRRAKQSVMAAIASNLCALLAPILTYTINEVLQHAPEIVRQGSRDVFDLRIIALYDVEPEADFDFAIQLRDKCSELLDTLKKDKRIKSGLELCIEGDFGDFTEVAQWLILSEYAPKEQISSFTLNGKTFRLSTSAGYRCERCWRYMAAREGGLCARCQEVLAR
ncbi:isoleucine--tRNA ligase [Helicobacter canis]|uniref:Isoleucine--tRNA ligase n=1 Tax=Helicobacter canis TaxID=29419 RepID=A0A377JN43_9HELI|nr:isoleucine--tRNA ligase [Helicobacter canis]STP06418.1 isoleucyl-tRNA synthetase [Helicobacter canis]